MSKNFTLTVATMARNEEKIMPYFIRHYADIVDQIVIIDNDSTDKTEEIAKNLCKDLGVKLHYLKLKTGGFNDAMKLSIFKSIQQGEIVPSDWYIIVDTDELIHDKSGDLKETLYKCYEDGYLYLKPTGYQMSEPEFPIYDGRKITDRCKMGCRDKGFDKPVVVHKSLTWHPLAGCHIAYGYSGVTPVEPFTKHEVLMLHYKFMGFDHRLERVRHVRDRLDSQGKQLLNSGIGTHTIVADEVLKEEYDGILSRREQIL